MVLLYKQDTLFDFLIAMSWMNMNAHTKSTVLLVRYSDVIILFFYGLEIQGTRQKFSNIDVLQSQCTLGIDETILDHLIWIVEYRWHV